MAQNISVVIIDSDIESINNIVKYVKNLGDSVTIEVQLQTLKADLKLYTKGNPWSS